MISFASEKDLVYLASLDQHVSLDVLGKKVRDGQVLIAKEEGKVIGCLRFGFFWDEHPFMNLLFVIPEHRRVGWGRKLVRFWEEEMDKQGYRVFLTSTLSNETAQHIYRKLGYQDIGGFVLPGEPLELILGKVLQS